MPIRCLVDLVAAVDKAKRPPRRAVNVNAWVRRWREKEAALYSDEKFGEREAQRQINALEISNIVEMIDIRAEGRNGEAPERSILEPVTLSGGVASTASIDSPLVSLLSRSGTLG